VTRDVDLEYESCTEFMFSGAADGFATFEVRPLCSCNPIQQTITLAAVASQGSGTYHLI
jgi:hypothetical protein